jgi:hypothetical protein
VSDKDTPTHLERGGGGQQAHSFGEWRGWWWVTLSKNRNSQKVNRSSSFCRNMGILVMLENYSEFSVTAVPGFDVDAVVVVSKNRLRSH